MPEEVAHWKAAKKTKKNPGPIVVILHKVTNYRLYRLAYDYFCANMQMNYAFNKPIYIQCPHATTVRDTN